MSAARRILPIIDIKNEISNDVNDQNLVIKNGNIKFNNVTFEYKNTDKSVLKSINLKMLGGKMTSIVGHSGAGKSTILNLIPRFFNCAKGEITIDEQPINKVSINSLRENISMVSQDTTLFDDTIKNNIAYANLDASQKQSNCWKKCLCS